LNRQLSHLIQLKEESLLSKSFL